MEGVQRVYDTGIRYTKDRYIPNTIGSVIYIVLYTVLVFYITEFLMRGKVTRLLYMGTMVMVVAMIYSGEVRYEENKGLVL